VSHFDALAPDYDRLRPAGEGWQELAGRTLAALEGARRLLDVGCGTGRFAVLAAERLGGRVWGVDASDEMLREARSRPGAERVGWRRADAAELPFKPGWFDAVHSHLVLHLVADRAAAVTEIARVLGPGGRVVVGTFAPAPTSSPIVNQAKCTQSCGGIRCSCNQRPTMHADSGERN